MSSLLFLALFGLTYFAYFALYFTFNPNNGNFNVSKYNRKCNFTSNNTNKNPYIYNNQDKKFYKFVSTFKT